MADDSMTFWDVLGQQGERGFSANLMERVLEQQLMDSRGHQRGFRRAARAVGSPPDLPEWVSGTTAAHAAGHAGVAGTEAAARELFSVILNRADSRNGHRRRSSRKRGSAGCRRAKSTDWFKRSA